MFREIYLPGFNGIFVLNKPLYKETLDFGILARSSGVIYAFSVRYEYRVPNPFALALNGRRTCIELDEYLTLFLNDALVYDFGAVAVVHKA